MLGTKKPNLLRKENYNESFSINNRFNSKIDTETFKNWAFSDKSANIPDEELETNYYIQIGNKVSRDVSRIKTVDIENSVFLLDEILENPVELDRLTKTYSFSNILNTFNALIEEGILEDFPSLIKEKFAHVFDAIDLINNNDAYEVLNLSEYDKIQYIQNCDEQK
ncbi:MAG: hypothetical protein PHG82_00265 [Candidatus Gracilibacteria bacterium]|nr:hypothetical protein [Candidatus Gracilibacteria bacterium]